MLALLALAGLIIRLYAVNFGLPGLYDPDEMMFELGAIRMLTKLTLNPGWFGHPATTTMYGLALCNLAVYAVGHVAGWFPTLKSFGDAIYADPSWIILPGRVLMTLFGAGVVFQTGKLGEALFNRRVGAVAAAIVAFSPLMVAWSQVIRSDVMGTFFLLLSLRGIVRAMASGSWRDDARAGAWLGVAIASKWPMALAGLAMIGAITREVLAGQISWPLWARRIASFSGAAIVTLLLISPYLILEWPTLLRNLQGEAQIHHVGATGGSFMFNAWWYISGPLKGGMDLVGLLLAGGGMILTLRRGRATGILWPVALGLFFVFCHQRLVWDRWMLPLIPILAIAAGFALIWLIDAAIRQWPVGARIESMAMLVLTLLVIAPNAFADLYQARARLNDTRQRASAWAVAHIPAGSSVMIEHFGFDLYPRPWRVMFPLAELGCIDARALLKGKVGYGLIDKVRAGRSNIDYGTMPASKADTCRTDFAILTQYNRYKAEQTDFPAEVQAYERLMARGRIVARFFPQPGVSGGPIVTVVDFRQQ